jgi:hypothetical protein
MVTNTFPLQIGNEKYEKLKNAVENYILTVGEAEGVDFIDHIDDEESYEIIARIAYHLYKKRPGTINWIEIFHGGEEWLNEVC